MAVNEIGAGSLQNVTPGKLNQDNTISKGESSRNIETAVEDENFKVEISLEAIELSRAARDKEIERENADLQNIAVQEQVQQQKNEEQAEAAEIVQRETVDLIV